MLLGDTLAVLYVQLTIKPPIVSLLNSKSYASKRESMYPEAVKGVSFQLGSLQRHLRVLTCAPDLVHSHSTLRIPTDTAAVSYYLSTLIAIVCFSLVVREEADC